MRFYDLNLIDVSRRRHFNMRRQTQLVRGKTGPRILALATAPVPHALSLALRNSLSIDRVSRLPPKHGTVRAALLAGGSHARTCSLVQQRVTRNQRVCIILPLIRRSRGLSLGSTISRRRHLTRIVFPRFAINLLRNGVSSTRGSTTVATFHGQRARVLISAAIIRINMSMPGTSIVLVRRTRQFNLSRLRRLQKQINHKTTRSFYLLLDDDHDRGTLRQLHILRRSRSNFFVTRVSLHFQKPKRMLNAERSNLPSLTLTDLVRSRSILVLTHRTTRTLLGRSPALTH